MSDPIPYWRGDPDYFSARDVRRPAHVAEIRRRRRLDDMVAAASGDGSYSVMVTQRDIER